MHHKAITNRASMRLRQTATVSQRRCGYLPGGLRPCSDVVHASRRSAAAAGAREQCTRSDPGRPPAERLPGTAGWLPDWLRSGLGTATLAACCLVAPPVLPSAALATEVAAGGELLPAGLEGAGVGTSAEAKGEAAPSGSGSGAGLQTVYFGNGCFWGRQKDFVDVELGQLGRGPERLTALVGYAAGTTTGPGGRVCYVYSDPRTHYDALGHAEVVQLGIDVDENDPRVAEREMRVFAARYFEQFRKTRFGMQRSDPQDRGPAYRNVVGLPGGVSSPWFRILQEENKYGMELREGRGNQMERGQPTEDDVLNTVWVVDSAQLPFYRAERYHQFHNGLGKVFPTEYLRDLRNKVAGLGRIEPTGCLELPF